MEFFFDLTEWLQLAEELSAIGTLVVDFTPIIPDIVRVMEDANRQMRIGQMDRYDRRMPDVLDPSSPRRGGTGPALLPGGEQSRAITEYRVVVVYNGPNYLRMQAGWTEEARFLEYHVDPYRGRPARDIMGLPIWVEEELDKVVVPFVDACIFEYAASMFAAG